MSFVYQRKIVSFYKFRVVQIILLAFAKVFFVMKDSMSQTFIKIYCYVIILLLFDKIPIL